MTERETQELYLLVRNVQWRYRLDQYEEEALKGILAAVDRAKAEVLEVLGRQKLTAWRRMRSREVEAVIDALTLAVREKLGEEILDVAAEAGAASVLEHSDIISFGGLAREFNDVILNPEQFRQFFGETPLGGRLLSDWVDAAFDSTVKNGILEEFRSGVLQGEGFPKLARRVARDFGLARREAITLTRTYVQSANVAAHQAVAEANRDIVKRWQWCATLEPGYRKTGRGTCLRCSALDGKEFELGQGPPMPLHPRCRCVPLPVTLTFRELGIDIDEIGYEMRPFTIRPDESIDAGGTRTIEEVGINKGSYATWFEKQGREFKLNVVGRERLKLLEAGKVKFADLVDDQGRLVTLTELGGKWQSGAFSPQPPKGGKGGIIRPGQVMSLDDARAALQDMGVKDLVFAENSKFRLIRDEIRELGYWHPTSLEDGVRIAGNYLANFTELKKRYPKIRFDLIDELLVTDIDRGFATLGWNVDRVLATGLISNWTPASIMIARAWERLNKRKWAAYWIDSYETPVHSTTRHELGHILTTESVFKDFLEACRNDKTNSLDWFRYNVSDYAGTAFTEAIAESFTIFTSKNYRPGMLPKNMEEVLSDMTKGNVGKPGTRPGASEEIMLEAPIPTSRDCRMIAVDSSIPGMEKKVIVVSKEEYERLKKKEQPE